MDNVDNMDNLDIESQDFAGELLIDSYGYYYTTFPYPVFSLPRLRPPRTFYAVVKAGGVFKYKPVRCVAVLTDDNQIINFLALRPTAASAAVRAQKMNDTLIQRASAENLALSPLIEWAEERADMRPYRDPVLPPAHPQLPPVLALLRKLLSFAWVKRIIKRGGQR